MKGWVKWSPFLLFLVAGPILAGFVDVLFTGIAALVPSGPLSWILQHLGTVGYIVLGVFLMQAWNYARGWTFRFPFGGE